ncbi:MAG: hypothetical protein O7E52_23885 [Candidatus Poribacteria bacterium]|nr:hypothetical protein [Candidatus Poribacteria bacterium]
MITPNYQQLIIERIKGLPSETLAEIADFIYFLRKRQFQPLAFEAEMQGMVLNTELRELSHAEETHLDKEFEGYDKRYPRG